MKGDGLWCVEVVHDFFTIGGLPCHFEPGFTVDIYPSPKCTYFKKSLYKSSKAFTSRKRKENIDSKNSNIESHVAHLG